MAQSTEIRSSSLSTPVGPLTVSADASGLTSVTWDGASGDANSTPPDGSARYGWHHTADIVARALQQLAEYFAGDRTTFDLPVNLTRLGASSLAVLTTLKDTVGYGETVTYGELAERSGSGVPARAIGSIMGSNPLPIVIGCHRVVAADGLGGYSGGAPGQGLQTKLWLLEHEGALPPALI